MIALPETIERLARLIAAKTGATPEQAIQQALEAQAVKVGVPLEGAKKLRTPGCLKGKLQSPDNMFEPLPDEELRNWWGGTA